MLGGGTGSGTRGFGGSSYTYSSVPTCAVVIYVSDAKWAGLKLCKDVLARPMFDHLLHVLCSHCKMASTHPLKYCPSFVVVRKA